MANLATVMSAAGYTVVYKGKWHCSKPAGSTWSPADLSAYGFSRWNPQDAVESHQHVVLRVVGRKPAEEAPQSFHRLPKWGVARKMACRMC